MTAKRRYSPDDDELIALEDYLAANLTPMSPRPAFVGSLSARLMTDREPGVFLEIHPDHFTRNLIIALVTLIGIPLVYMSGRRGVHVVASALRQWRAEPAI